VVLITGSQDRSKRLAGLEAGADDFLNKPIDISEFRTRVHSLVRVKRLTDELESTEAIMTLLGQIVEARDPYTEGHCERLAEYATMLGKALGLGSEDLDTLQRGAFLHDLGKIAIPDGILLKEGPLNAEESALMKRHPVIGDSLCRTVKSLDRVRPIVRSHHERVDGRGYPDGLSGDAIPIVALIVGVVDVFDALTTNRPYRRALPKEAAYKVMLEGALSGWCSPQLVTSFIELQRDRRKPVLMAVDAPRRAAAQQAYGTMLASMAARANR
jgi:putative two-component system response regulator